MKLVPSRIRGVCVVESEELRDERGSFSRLFCAGELQEIVGQRQILQINRSSTRATGSVRGIHFQYPPHAEMKLVRCLKGRVWDVAADLRAGSPTLLRWEGWELTPGNGRMIVIPEGCGHGFQTLEDDSELLYLHTAFYHRDAEGGVQPSDPALGISWPLPISNLSERDRQHPLLPRDFSGVAV